HCHRLDFVDAPPVEHKIADLFSHRHDLVEADPAAIAGSSAADAADNVEHGTALEAIVLDRPRRQLGGAFAMAAQRSRKALCHDAVDRRYDHERFNAH